MKHLAISAAALALTAGAALAVTDLAQIDTDKDGFASMEELAAVYQGLTPGDFETMDANKDNRLDENELLSADAQAVLNRYSVTQEGASVVDVAALDADKDGFVSQEELLAVYPGVTPGEFEDMDQNGDNRLDSDELYGEAARTVLKQSGSSGPGQELTDVAALDADKDSFVSKDELLAAYPGVTDEQFTEMDANGDGRLDTEELYAQTAQQYLK